jgi:hypothetical protein
MKYAVAAACALLLTSACQPAPSKTPVAPTTTNASPTAPAPSPNEPAGEQAANFGFDRVKESCGSFSAHFSNAEQTRMLDVYVDVDGLGLSAGSHDLAVADGRVRLAITELTKPLVGEWSCTDIAAAPHEARARWKATGGTVRLQLHARDKAPLPHEGAHDRVDVELIDVRFVGEGGEERTVNLRFKGLSIGWLPG